MLVGQDARPRTRPGTLLALHAVMDYVRHVARDDPYAWRQFGVEPGVGWSKERLPCPREAEETLESHAGVKARGTDQSRALRQSRQRPAGQPPSAAPSHGAGDLEAAAAVGSTSETSRSRVCAENGFSIRCASGESRARWESPYVVPDM
jgi:hypothetical protein